MKLTILLCSLLFVAIAAKDGYVEGATTVDSPGAAAVDPAAQLGVNEAASYMYFEDVTADSYQTKAPLNEALGTLERGSSTDPTPKNCDALTDRKTCKKKDRKKVTSNPTLTFNPLTLP